MNTQDLNSFNKEIEKSAILGRLVKKMFKRSKKPFGERVSEAGKNLKVTGAIMGTLGVGGVGYHTLKDSTPLGRDVMRRGPV